MTTVPPTGETGPEPPLLAEFHLTRHVAALLAIVSTGGFVCFAALFESVRRWLVGDSLPITGGTIAVSTPTEMLVDALPLVALLVGLTAVHELLHGAFMSRYGGRVTYGVGLSYLFPYAYAKGDGAVYTRDQLLVVLVAPLVCLSVAGLLALAAFPYEVLAVALAANAAGSMADCWMATVLVRYPSGARVTDPADAGSSGFAIYGTRDDAAGAVATGTRTILAFVAGAFATLGVLFVGSVLCVFYSAATGTGTVLLGDPAGFWFLFGHEFDPEAGIARFEMGWRLVIAAAVAGGACAAGVSALRARFRDETLRLA